MNETNPNYLFNPSPTRPLPGLMEKKIMTPQSNVFNMDCMEGMKGFPDGFFDLAICDPPYGIGIHKANYIHANNKVARQKNGTTLRVKKQVYRSGMWDSEIPTLGYFNELKRVSVNQIIWGWNYFNLDWRGGIIKWDKMVPDGVGFGRYEYAYCSLLDREITFQYLWSGMLQGKSIEEPSRPRGNKRLNEKRIHPTQKPIVLYQWLLQNFAKTGDKILDTHLGSQSSRIASFKLGYSFTGYELDRFYFESGCKRFAQSIAEPLFDQPKTEQGKLL